MVEKGLFLSVFLLIIASCIHLCAGNVEDGSNSVSLEIGFEQLRYECPESSSQQVCLLVTGHVNSSFSIVVSTQEGIATGE